MSKALAWAIVLCGVPMAPPAHSAVPLKGHDLVLRGVYTVDPLRTRVGFTVSHLGFGSYSGQFSGATGGLELGAAAKSKVGAPDGSSVNISVPVASVSTANDMLDDELKGSDWLDAKAFPLMTFTSTSVSTEGTVAKVVGALTLHGVTRPVAFDVRFVGAGVDPTSTTYTAEFEISGDIKRSDFGVTGFRPMVGDDVHLSIDAAFDKR